jgi:hypothetical protein
VAPLFLPSAKRVHSGATSSSRSDDCCVRTEGRTAAPSSKLERSRPGFAESRQKVPRNRSDFGPSECSWSRPLCRVFMERGTMRCDALDWTSAQILIPSSRMWARIAFDCPRLLLYNQMMFAMICVRIHLRLDFGLVQLHISNLDVIRLWENKNSNENVKNQSAG